MKNKNPKKLLEVSHVWDERTDGIYIGGRLYVNGSGVSITDVLERLSELGLIEFSVFELSGGVYPKTLKKGIKDELLHHVGA